MKPRRAYSGGPPGGSTTSAGLFLSAAATGGASGVNATPMVGRTANSASSGRATSGFAEPGRSLRHRAHPHSTHLTMANRANRWLLQRAYSARYLEARFETTAVVGHLSQSNATGRAFGHTKSDGSLVFSAVLKDEQGLLSFLLVPPSPQRTPPGGRRAADGSRLWDPAGRSVGVLHSNPDGNREALFRG
jgi:hypothetical protein